MEVVSPEVAHRMQVDGRFLVDQQVLGHIYGISAASVRKLQASGKLPLLDLDHVADVAKLRASGFQVSASDGCSFKHEKMRKTCMQVRHSRAPLVCFLWRLIKSVRVGPLPQLGMHSSEGLWPLTLQATYVYLQPPSLGQLQQRIRADIKSNPPLHHDPEDAANAAAAEAAEEATAAAAQPELFDVVLTHDSQVSFGLVELGDIGVRIILPFLPPGWWWHLVHTLAWHTLYCQQLAPQVHHREPKHYVTESCGNRYDTFIYCQSYMSQHIVLCTQEVLGAVGQLSEVLHERYPTAIPSSFVWGYGRPLWDLSSRVHGFKPLRVMLLGPAASGKSTQCAILASRYVCANRT